MVEHAQEARSRAFTVVVGVLVLAVVVVAACVAWVGWGSAAWARSHQADALAGYRSDCTGREFETAEDGAVIGSLAIASLGVEAPIRKGTDGVSLRGGVGWYPASAEPGQVGNFAVAGYRVGYGKPFAGLLDLDEGAEITVQVCRDTYTYVVDVAPRDLTVDSSDSWVLDSVPGRPEQLPGEVIMTLTANQDLLPTGDRSVGFARLRIATER
ncbi:class E sortase [Propionibacterium australiense]|uniref:Sortase n=1 Tax=Propionibacterium australiense TaxID=119981 RepID=A0A383S6L6_9ACTN|nr:class E sortase [Propionibacterium australiense]RLP09997.1 sortase [Propionibacterium australiense]RLP11282.1 sortase [Propionibacterium australiense]SYZ32906.1 Sortase family [Propionibacterium australiense]VEH92457.1 Sortase (surface protein transpeptidase) [Propionibacterium australiense]